MSQITCTIQATSSTNEDFEPLVEGLAQFFSDATIPTPHAGGGCFHFCWTCPVDEDNLPRLRSRVIEWRRQLAFRGVTINHSLNVLLSSELIHAELQGLQAVPDTETEANLVFGM